MSDYEYNEEKVWNKKGIKNLIEKSSRVISNFKIIISESRLILTISFIWFIIIIIEISLPR